MNRAHMEMLASEDWRNVLRDLAFPFAFGDAGPGVLGADPLEIGPGPGLSTDLLSAELSRLTVLELDPDLAAALAARVDGGRVTVTEGDATAMPFEDGRFTGAVCFTMLHHMPTIEAQDRLFTEACRVLGPGGRFIANDSVASDDLAALHDGDVYNPVDPATLDARLQRAGFVDLDVRANEFAFAVTALRGS